MEPSVHNGRERLHPTHPSRKRSGLVRAALAFITWLATLTAATCGVRRTGPSTMTGSVYSPGAASCPVLEKGTLVLLRSGSLPLLIVGTLLAGCSAAGPALPPAGVPVAGSVPAAERDGTAVPAAVGGGVVTAIALTVDGRRVDVLSGCEQNSQYVEFEDAGHAKYSIDNIQGPANPNPGPPVLRRQADGVETASVPARSTDQSNGTIRFDAPLPVGTGAVDVSAAVDLLGLPPCGE